MPYVGRRHGEALLLDGVNGNGVAVLRAGKLGSLLPENGEALKVETQGDTFARLPAHADQVVAVACFQLRRQTQPHSDGRESRRLALDDVVELCVTKCGVGRVNLIDG